MRPRGRGLPRAPCELSPARAPTASSWPASPGKSLSSPTAWPPVGDTDTLTDTDVIAPAVGVYAHNPGSLDEPVRH
jgi:hypothetical protein